MQSPRCHINETIAPAYSPESDFKHLIRESKPLSEYGSTPNLVWVTFCLLDFCHPIGKSHAKADIHIPLGDEYLRKIAWQLSMLPAK